MSWHEKKHSPQFIDASIHQSTWSWLVHTFKHGVCAWRPYLSDKIYLKRRVKPDPFRFFLFHWHNSICHSSVCFSLIHTVCFFFLYIMMLRSNDAYVPQQSMWVIIWSDNGFPPVRRQASIVNQCRIIVHWTLWNSNQGKTMQNGDHFLSTPMY